MCRTAAARSHQLLIRQPAGYRQDASPLASASGGARSGPGHPLATLVPPHCCIAGVRHALLPQPRLLAEERSSFSSSSLLSEPVGSFVGSSPHAVSVADYSRERQRGREKGEQGKGGSGGPSSDGLGRLRCEGGAELTAAFTETPAAPCATSPGPVTFTKRPYSMLPELPALRGFLLLILTPCSESVFTEMPFWGERDARGSGAFCPRGFTPPSSTSLPPRSPCKVLRALRWGDIEQQCKGHQSPPWSSMPPQPDRGTPCCPPALLPAQSPRRCWQPPR